MLKVARIKETDKVLDKDKSLVEQIRTLFHDQGITIILMLVAFSGIFSKIVSTAAHQKMTKPWKNSLAS